MALYLLQGLREKMAEYFSPINHTHSNTGSFTELKTLINDNEDGIIILDKDYKYNSTTDSGLTNGVTIEKNITIIGNGHIIDGNNTRRAFYINGNYTVNLNDLILQNNKATYGGAIRVDNSQVNINNSILQNNKATTYGGAIDVKNSNITITQSILQNNTSNNYGGAFRAGGNSHANITTTTLQNNNATQDGGAIYVENSQINMNHSIIKNNNAANYANIYYTNSNPAITTVYNCDIDNITTTCYNVTNINYMEVIKNVIGMDYYSSFSDINVVSHENEIQGYSGANTDIEKGRIIAMYFDTNEYVYLEFNGLLFFVENHDENGNGSAKILNLNR